jgi:hypothetical protein
MKRPVIDKQIGVPTPLRVRGVRVSSASTDFEMAIEILWRADGRPCS